jgi:hypothetical protein
MQDRLQDEQERLQNEHIEQNRLNCSLSLAKSYMYPVSAEETYTSAK